MSCALPKRRTNRTPRSFWFLVACPLKTSRSSQVCPPLHFSTVRLQSKSSGADPFSVSLDELDEENLDQSTKEFSKAKSGTEEYIHVRPNPHASKQLYSEVHP